MNMKSCINTCNFYIGLALVAFILGVPAARATVTFTYSGTSSIGTPVSFEADLTLASGKLTVQLFNNSPTNSLGPNDALGSFYFDIVGAGNTRPTLTYSSAVGDVYLGSRTSTDTLQTHNANLMAVNDGDDTWQFQTMSPTSNPFLGFGIGTVGNNGITPNNFQGSIVGGVDYAIYRNEVITQNLDDKLLVKNTATFKFTGLAGFTESDIAHSVAFGLGTAPDSIHFVTVPEPSSVSLAMAGIILLGLLGRKRH